MSGEGTPLFQLHTGKPLNKVVFSFELLAFILKKYLWWLVVFVYMEDSKLATLLGTDEDKIIRHPPPHQIFPTAVLREQGTFNTVFLSIRVFFRKHK